MKLYTFLILLFPLIAGAQKNPVELGHVKWLRNYDEAQARSTKENKPILLLFQEIPGCETCKNYGSNILTQPLLVEAIETEFIPLAIYNNKGGHDAEILRRFNEPSWNNPVVRILNKDGKEVASRLSGNYTAAGLVTTMTTALVKYKTNAPLYLQLYSDELTAMQRGTASVTYSMYCFWTGEVLFGKLNGVIKTTAGFQGGKEVVEVIYDPMIITKDALDQVAKQKKCSPASQGNLRPDSTPKYYLSNSKYKNVVMTEIQKCRVNSALGEGQDPELYLSPRQLKL